MIFKENHAEDNLPRRLSQWSLTVEVAGGNVERQAKAGLTAIWPGGQEVKTSPFHGGNTGSIPVRVTNPWNCSEIYIILRWIRYMRLTDA